MNSTAADNPAWPTREAPQQLGLYRIVRPLGRGGMGMVFEAVHTLLRQRAAVKVMHPALARDPAFAARFRREMAALGQVPADPHLVRAHYAGEEQGSLYLVMDFIEGEDLARLLSTRGPFPPAEACEAVRQAALGLETIRRVGLVHRDLKPSNLILTPDGTVKILDLGLARLREPDSPSEELTPTNLQLGTFDYQAPEQADDPRRVDVRADVYSLGCTLYALLTGRPPFHQHGPAAKKMYAHAHLPFPTAGPAVPAGVAAVLARMTAKEPAGRYATPRELADALTPLAAGADLSHAAGRAAGGPAAHEATTLDHRAGPAALTTISGPAPARPVRRRVWPLLISSCAALVLAALVVAALFRTPGPRVEPPPADPILAAGPTPRDLDGLTPNLIHDLLDRAPVQAYWDEADGTAYRAYDAGGKQLRVNSPREGLFHLGVIHVPSYTLMLKIQQTQWRRGAGMYIGFRDAPGGKGSTFQYLVFSERATRAGAPVYDLVRGRCLLSDAGGRPSFAWRDEASQDIDEPTQEAWLIVEVVGRRLYRVFVNGLELKKLTDPSINNTFTDADAQGCVGLLTSANSCVFREATLTPQPSH